MAETTEGQKPEKGGSPDPGANGKSRMLTRKQAIAQLQEDVALLVERLAPIVFDGADETEGSEKASIKLSIDYNPGGKSSKSRFDVTGKASIPARGFEREAVIHTTRGGESQLRMFQPEG